MRITKSILLTIITIIGNNYAISANLIEVYQLARENDKKLQTAYHKNQADMQSLPQARAAFLPTLNSSLYSKDSYSTDPVLEKYNTWGYQLTLSQPIFRFTDWTNLAQAKNKVKASLATLEDAEQDLLLRVSNQYFSILKAQNDLNFANAEYKAFSGYLQQMQQRFKVGIIAITDVQEATSKRDSAYSRKIIAENSLENEKEKLQEIIATHIETFQQVNTKISLPKPDPENIETWVKTALEQNWQLQAARHTLASAKEAITKERSGHLPTLSIDVIHGRVKNPPPNNIYRPINTDIGLNLNFPLLSGGNVFFKTKAAAESYEQAFADLENQFRSVESNARQSYRNVFNKIAQVTALKQAVLSSKAALAATKSAFDVGTRTTVDVLNAQSDILHAERDYYQAHYEYITESLKMKKNAGILSVLDLEAVNQWLEKTMPKTTEEPVTPATPTTTPVTEPLSIKPVKPAPAPIAPIKETNTVQVPAIPINKPVLENKIPDKSNEDAIDKAIDAYSQNKPNLLPIEEPAFKPTVYHPPS